MMRTRALAALAATALLVSPACNSSTSPSTVVPSTGFGIAAYVSTIDGVTSPAVPGTIHPGLPVGSTGPAVTATGTNSAVQSGGSVIQLHSAATFSQVFVSIGNATPPITGFWELDLPTPVTDLSVLVGFSSGLPTTPFDLDFQVASPAGAVGPIAPLTTTLAADVTTVPPSIVVSYTPNPAPFLNGVACTLSSRLGCLWEFKVVLQEFNGVQLPTAQVNETFTFPASTISDSVPTSVPARGVATIVTGLSCGPGGTACATSDELLGGTYNFTLTGTDVNGHPFTMAGTPLPLTGATVTTSRQRIGGR